jgi:hypothetical protein
MQKRATRWRVTAKDLGLALRHRLRLKPDEEVELTVIKRTAARKKSLRKDPWLAIKGTLTPEEAREMRRKIKSGRRSSMKVPDVDVP